MFASGFDDLRASLRAYQRNIRLAPRNEDRRVLAFSDEMFAHANEYREVFGAMVGKRSGATVQRLLHKLLTDLVREDVKRIVPRAGGNAESTEAIVQFVGAGMLGLLVWWLDRKAQLSTDDINTLFRRLALPVLKSAAQGEISQQLRS